MTAPPPLAPKPLRLARAGRATLVLTLLALPMAWRFGGRRGAFGWGAGGAVMALSFDFLRYLVERLLVRPRGGLWSTGALWILKDLLLGGLLVAALRLGADPTWFAGAITLFVLTIVIYGLIDARASS